MVTLKLQNVEMMTGSHNYTLGKSWFHLLIYFLLCWVISWNNNVIWWHEVTIGRDCLPTWNRCIRTEWERKTARWPWKETTKVELRSPAAPLSACHSQNISKTGSFMVSTATVTSGGKWNKLKVEKKKWMEWYIERALKYMDATLTHTISN